MNWFITHHLADRELILLLALIVGSALAGPLHWYHAMRFDRPGQWLRHFVRRAENKLNRKNRSTSKRIYRGMILTAFLCIITIALSLAITTFNQRWYYGDYLEVLLLTLLIPTRHIWDQALHIESLIRTSKNKEALAYCSSLSGRTSNPKDDHAACRVAIEHLMMNLSYKIIAPIIAYICFGLAGAALVRILHLIDEAIGHASPRYIAFGWSAAKLDKIIHFAPARITAWLIAIASFFIPRCHPIKALITPLRDCRKSSTLNRCWPLAATAGALHISLGGSRLAGDSVATDAWLGNGSAKATLHDLRRALWLYVTTLILIVLALASSLLFTLT